MERRMTADTAPALGDIRQMGHGDTVWLSPGLTTEAIGAATLTPSLPL